MLKKHSISDTVAQIIGGSIGQIVKGFLIATGAIIAVKLFF